MDFAITTSAGKQFQTETILDEKKYLDLLHLEMGTVNFKWMPTMPSSSNLNLPIFAYTTFLMLSLK